MPRCLHDLQFRECAICMGILSPKQEDKQILTGMIANIRTWQK